MVVAYLRVSTNKQHLMNQKEEIRKFAKSRKLTIDKWYNDVVSGNIASHNRKLGRLLDILQEGDCLIVTEVSRLSRTLIDVMNIINTCICRKITLHCTKEGYTFENNLNSKIMGFAFGLVAEIERNLISARTREALAVRRAEGKALGRPHGSTPQLKILYNHRDQVWEYIMQKMTYKQIAEIYNVSIGTMNRFMKLYKEEGYLSSIDEYYYDLDTTGEETL